MKTVFLYIATAFAEIVGCYALAVDSPRWFRVASCASGCQSGFIRMATDHA